MVRGWWPAYGSASKRNLTAEWYWDRGSLYSCIFVNQMIYFYVSILFKEFLVSNGNCVYMCMCVMCVCVCVLVEPRPLFFFPSNDFYNEMVIFIRNKEVGRGRVRLRGALVRILRFIPLLTPHWQYSWILNF